MDTHKKIYMVAMTLNLLNVFKQLLRNVILSDN